MAEAVDTKLCSNCKRQIAAANFVMHEVHCKRNIVLCEHCSEPVPRSDLQQHIDDTHAEVKCSKCGQEVEICRLEKHESEFCPKRPATCEYCELEFAYSDIKDHRHYCGSRTEPCVLCGQFIMHKDQQRHEDSSCAYPAPKPQGNGLNNVDSNTRTPARVGLRPAYEDPVPSGDYYSSFALDELTRMLNQPAQSGFYRPNHGANDAAASRNQSSLVSASTGRTAVGAAAGNGIRNSQKSNRVKRTNEISGNRNRSTGNSFNANAGAAKRGDRSSEQMGEADLDQLLAMHLAHDLNQEADSDFHDVSGASSFDRLQSLEGDPADDIAIPCEFCGDLFPVEQLIQHQSTCAPHEGPASGMDSVPDADSELRTPASSIQMPNNSATRSLSIPGTGQPHIVDNLSYLAVQDWLSNPIDSSYTTEGEVMLPCEFCDALFPEEFLVQHQAICDANTTATPRVRSPNIASAMARRRLQQSTQTRDSSLRSRIHKRQGDPTFSFLGDADESHLDKKNRPKPDNRSKMAAGKRHSGQSYGSSSLTPSMRPRQASRPERVPSGQSRYSRQRGDHVNASGDGDSAQTVLKERPEQRRKGSAARVHETLDQLLRDPSYTTQDILAHMDKKEKSRTNQQSKDRGESLPAGRGLTSTGVKARFIRRPVEAGGVASGNQDAVRSHYQASFAEATTASSNSRQPTRSTKPRTVPRTTVEPDLSPSASAMRVSPGNRTVPSSTSRSKKPSTRSKPNEHEDKGER